MPLSPLWRGEEILDLRARLVLRRRSAGRGSAGRSCARRCAAASRKELCDDVGAAWPIGGRGERDRPGTPPSVSRTPASGRYSGRKSWPHCEMQCASSMARRRTPARLQPRGEGARWRAARARRRAGGACPRSSRRQASSLANSSVDGVERRRGDAEAPHLLDLVAHQRDQRRDDERQPAVERSPGAGSRATCRCRSA